MNNSVVDVSTLQLLFYYSPERPDDMSSGKTIFFAKANEDSKSWSLRYRDWEDVCTTILESTSFHLYRSFMSFVETQIQVLSAMVYRKHPSLGLYFDDLYAIRLPYPAAVTAWSTLYSTRHCFTLAEAMQQEPKDALNQWPIPTGVRNFALELILKCKLAETAALEWYPAIRLFRVKLAGSEEVLPECFVFTTREFANLAMKPWLRPDGDVDVVLLNRRTLRRQIQWVITHPITQRLEKVFLFVV